MSELNCYSLESEKGEKFIPSWVGKEVYLYNEKRNTLLVIPISYFEKGKMKSFGLEIDAKSLDKLDKKERLTFDIEYNKKLENELDAGEVYTYNLCEGSSRHYAETYYKVGTIKDFALERNLAKIEDVKQEEFIWVPTSYIKNIS